MIETPETASNDDAVLQLARPNGETLAYRQVGGTGPTVIWIGGFRSDMQGTKALALEAASRERGWSYLRYDHFAHGQSTGDWRSATIGRWREDAVAVIDSLSGPAILVGSSMGGWIALLAALARPDAVVGLVLINPAQDFTERLMWPGLADHERQAILRDGETTVIEDGLGSYVLTRAMFEEARDWLLLDADIALATPVHVLQGRADAVVPWRHAMALVERLKGADVRLDLIEGGDHRLSTPNDLSRLIEAVAAMRETALS
ncbi:alpha/beta hydrolase [soil metagenome]